MRTTSGSTNERSIWAALDPDALVARDPTSRTREAILVVGNAPNSDHVMVVILLPDDPLPTGLWYVVTAWAADRRRRRTYWDGEDLMTPADRDLLDKINLEARDSDPGRGTEQRCRRKRGSKAQSVVCGLRLPAARVEQLQRLAASRGIEPSAPPMWSRCEGAAGCL